MKRSRLILTVGAGILCVLLLLASSWYSIEFNESRLVVPTDFSTYVFRRADLPMIVSIALFCAYAVYLVVLIGKSALQQRKQIRETNTTRKLNPRFGFLGFAGFLGFLGFWTYQEQGILTPFLFLGFFGFFGFFFEGKMSNTFMDERYRENALRAQLSAFKIAFCMIVMALVNIAVIGRGAGHTDYLMISTVILLALSVGSTAFFYEYFLYRYDRGLWQEEGGE